MVLKSTRTFTNTQHKIVSKCEIKTGESQELKVSAAMILDEEDSSYIFPEKQIANYAGIGQFTCFAQIAGDNFKREYQLSEGGQTLIIVLGPNTVDRVPLRRLN